MNADPTPHPATSSSPSTPDTRPSALPTYSRIHRWLLRIAAVAIVLLTLLLVPAIFGSLPHRAAPGSLLHVCVLHLEMNDRGRTPEVDVLSLPALQERSEAISLYLSYALLPVAALLVIQLCRARWLGAALVFLLLCTFMEMSAFHGMVDTMTTIPKWRQAPTLLFLFRYHALEILCTALPIILIAYVIIMRWREQRMPRGTRDSFA